MFFVLTLTLRLRPKSSNSSGSVGAVRPERSFDVLITENGDHGVGVPLTLVFGAGDAAAAGDRTHGRGPRIPVHGALATVSGGEPLARTRLGDVVVAREQVGGTTTIAAGTACSERCGGFSTLASRRKMLRCQRLTCTWGCLVAGFSMRVSHSWRSHPDRPEGHSSLVSRTTSTSSACAIIASITRSLASSFVRRSAASGVGSGGVGPGATSVAMLSGDCDAARPAWAP